MNKADINRLHVPQPESYAWLREVRPDSFLNSRDVCAIFKFRYVTGESIGLKSIPEPDMIKERGGAAPRRFWKVRTILNEIHRREQLKRSLGRAT